VATTFQLWPRKYLAMSSPKPDEQPVMRTVFMMSPLVPVHGETCGRRRADQLSQVVLLAFASVLN